MGIARLVAKLLYTPSIMARLPEACEVLVASLEKAQAEIEWIAHKLEEEFSAKHKNGQINPLDLLTRIHRLKRYALP
jgi:hypothetical protein